MRMELGLEQIQTIKQIQTLSPQMYMSMEILCLNTLDLEEKIETEVEDNVALELESDKDGVSTDGDSTDADGGESQPAEDRASETAEVAEPQAEPQAESQAESQEAGDDDFDQRFEQWTEYTREEYGSRRSRYDGERDAKLEALTNTEDRPATLQERLEAQVDLLEEELEPFVEGLDEQEREQIHELCRDIIYNIDNRGYLMYSVEEIHASLDPPRPRIDLLQRSLAVVQSLDPPGIGGRDLVECLLLQLGRDRQQYPLEERIVRDHLEDLGHNRLPKISKALGVSIEDIKTATENLASLNPRPGLLFGGDAPRFIKPDVVVDDVEGKYVVRVESDYLPRLRISSHYQQLYREGRKNPEIRRYLKKKFDNAEWLIAAIRQRQSTLQKISEQIVEIQSGFLDHGISRLRPLKMVEVAERVGVHVSTISRAISGKYIQTPRGIFALKYFFTGGATKSDGSTEARGSVIQRIKDFIKDEDKDNPFSDIFIAKKLAEDCNINISRRTVTKYREAEGIASSRERRVY